MLNWRRKEEKEALAETLLPLSVDAAIWPRKPDQWTRWTRFLAWTPGVGFQEKVYRSISKQLRCRDLSCMLLWSNDEMVRNTVNAVSKTLAACFGWPNTFFIPEDPFDLIFFDRFGDLAEVEACMSLEDAFDLPDDLVFSFVARDATYGEFMEAIVELMKVKR